MFQRIKTKEGKLYNSFFEGNIIPNSKYLKTNRGKENNDSITHKDR